jgi:hypothetical protein
MRIGIQQGDRFLGYATDALTGQDIVYIKRADGTITEEVDQVYSQCLLTVHEIRQFGPKKKAGNKPR